MDLKIGTLRPIKGALEVIDDVGIPKKAHPIICNAFSVETGIIAGQEASLQLWSMVRENINLDGRVLVVYPGNGGWLIQRLLRLGGEDPNPFVGVNVSRVTEHAIPISRGFSHIIVIEDVIETAGTAERIRRQINGVDCPVTLAALLWHDRQGTTQSVMDRLSGYDNVVVPLRIRSDLPAPVNDIRSLSTLARMANQPKNLQYSGDRVEQFLGTMNGCLQRHAWLTRLGIDLGYRLESRGA